MASVRLDAGPVLVTGASGFVGRALVERLRADGVQTLAAVRDSAALPPGAQWAPAPNLGPNADWRPVLAGAACVVHLAGRAHIMRDGAADPLAEFRRVNVDGTLALARQAAAAGVQRLVFVSSVKVNGECTTPGRPFTADDVPSPSDPYSISKHEAEQALWAVAAETGLQVVVVRPVLVYGPGVRANFLALLNALARGLPLPFGNINNRRSLIAIDNLVDLLARCIDHPAAAGQVFLSSDGEDLSTSELVRRLGRALGKPARLVPLPAPWLSGAGRLLGRRSVVQRLCGSLQVDIGKARNLLGWTPPVTVDEALRKTAHAFLAQR